MKYKFNTWYYDDYNEYVYVIDAVGESVYSGGDAYFSLTYKNANNIQGNIYGRYTHLHPEKWQDEITEQVPKLDSEKKRRCITQIFERIKA